jgi:hypothetical protein
MEEAQRATYEYVFNAAKHIPPSRPALSQPPNDPPPGMLSSALPAQQQHCFQPLKPLLFGRLPMQPHQRPFFQPLTPSAFNQPHLQPQQAKPSNALHAPPPPPEV